MNSEFGPHFFKRVKPQLEHKAPCRSATHSLELAKEVAFSFQNTDVTETAFGLNIGLNKASSDAGTSSLLVGLDGGGPHVEGSQIP